MATPITASARRDYQAVHHGKTRTKARCQYIVTHGGQAPTAEGMARWFTDERSGGSTQLCIDGAEKYRTLSDLVIPYGAPPLNETGLHAETASFAWWKPADWTARKRMIQRTAWAYAEWSIDYNIPVRWLKAKQLLALGKEPGPGRGGFTSHVEITKAWGQSDHTDPGAGFELPDANKRVPRIALMSWTRKYRKQMLAPPKPKKKAKPKSKRAYADQLDAQSATIPANQERRR
ncbi:MAG: hypothetical protein M0R37_12805 [Bacteroidales bacterium]|nr:hypothetical protein [Bacteroidales bacterium]